MSRIRFARRSLQDLWDYDRWRGHPNQGWDPDPADGLDSLGS